MSARVVRVTIRAVVQTECPKGGRDLNAVAVTFRPGPMQVVDADDMRVLVRDYAGLKLYAEQLAEIVAAAAARLVGRRVTVVVNQLEGHGVEAEATCGVPEVGAP